jgi:uncharacterized protein YqeY
MTLKAEIHDAMKSAMKRGERVELESLRFLLSVLHNEQIKVRRELTDQEVQKAITTLCKQRNEAIELFQRGGRQDLAAKEEAELRILEKFLPEPLTEDEVRALIRASIDEVGAQGVQDLGKVMKSLMPKVSGRSDGKRLNQLAKEILAGEG